MNTCNIYKLSLKFRFKLRNGCNTKSVYLFFAQYTHVRLLSISQYFNIIVKIVNVVNTDEINLCFVYALFPLYH